MRASLFGQREGLNYNSNSFYVNPYSDRYLSSNYYPVFYSDANHYPHNNYHNTNYNNYYLVPYSHPYPSVTPHPHSYFPISSYGYFHGNQKEFLLPSKGLEQILIAILILVALDLIFIRSR